ncbi:unnamed protein product, partial [Vitis vinifera]|uniref:Uncharacterized protein n=1 Tax=Vitis vinifera TaxID=29760 RepID=D7SZS3_VITVI
MDHQQLPFQLLQERIAELCPRMKLITSREANLSNRTWREAERNAPPTKAPAISVSLAKEVKDESREEESKQTQNETSKPEKKIIEKIQLVDGKGTLDSKVFMVDPPICQLSLPTTNFIGQYIENENLIEDFHPSYMIFLPFLTSTHILSTSFDGPLWIIYKFRVLWI